MEKVPDLYTEAGISYTRAIWCDKTKNEIITEEAVRKPIQKEGYSQSNPTVAKTDKNPPSRHDSEPVDMQPRQDLRFYGSM